MHGKDGTPGGTLSHEFLLQMATPSVAYLEDSSSMFRENITLSTISNMRKLQKLIMQNEIPAISIINYVKI